jgi:hypothetical protein
MRKTQTCCGSHYSFTNSNDRGASHAAACAIARFLDAELETGGLVTDAQSGTLSRSSSSQTSASESLGARQSPRGLSEPPEPTFGLFGKQERLN